MHGEYYMLMKNAKPGEAYNIGGDGLHSMGDFLDIMLNIANLKDVVQLEINPAWIRKIDIPVQIPDSTKLRKLTG